MENNEYIPTVQDSDNVKHGIFSKSMFLAGGFLFTYGKFIKDINYGGLSQLHHIFNGEEILIAILAYTNGWEFFTPAKNIAYHKYSEIGDKPLWWEDNKTDSNGMDKITDFLRNLPYDSQIFKLGKEKTINQYWNEIGYDINSKEKLKWNTSFKEKLCSPAISYVYNF